MHLDVFVTSNRNGENAFKEKIYLKET